MRKIILLLSVTIMFMQHGWAQTPLPYHTGFDDATQRAGWQQFRKGSTQYASWDVATSSASYLYHDYPVGAATTDTVTDWYVSPQFDFSSGGLLDSLKIIPFAFAGHAQLGDFLGIYLLNGSADPALATSATLLAELTNMASGAHAWRDTGNFTIPATNGVSYIAFKYNASQDWFTPSIDDIYISGARVGVKNIANPGVQISVYPNPAVSNLTITSNRAFIGKVCFFDMTGRMAGTHLLNTVTQINLANYAAGTYLCRITDGNNEVVTASLVTIVK